MWVQVLLSIDVRSNLLLTVWKEDRVLPAAYSSSKVLFGEADLSENTVKTAN